MYITSINICLFLISKYYYHGRQARYDDPQIIDTFSVLYLTEICRLSYTMDILYFYSAFSFMIRWAKQVSLDSEQHPPMQTLTVRKAVVLQGIKTCLYFLPITHADIIWD